MGVLVYSDDAFSSLIANSLEDILQRKMIANAWNINKSIMDKNSDNIMQYIMIKGESESVLIDERTKYSNYVI